MKFSLKASFLILVLLICRFLTAESVDVNGSFQSKNKTGCPDGWTIHTWEGYKPFPEVTTKPIARSSKHSDSKKQQSRIADPKEADAARSANSLKSDLNSINVLKISNVLGPDGGAIQTKEHFPVRSGSVGRISFMARGKGLAWVTFYRWGKNNEWNGVIVSAPFRLSDTWQPQILTVPIDNGHACETFSVSLAIGGKTGLDLEMADLKLDLTVSQTVGDLRIPQKWTVFPPVPDSYRPPKDLLDSNSKVPQSIVFESIDGSSNGKSESDPNEARSAQRTLEKKITGRVFGLNAGRLILSPMITGSLKGQSIWAFASLNAKYDCDITLGIASDCGMTCYLNGEPVFKKDPVNTKSSPAENDRLLNKTVRLKKGFNTFAVQLTNAKKDSVLNLAGPADLRGIVRKLVFVEKTAQENFDSSKTICGGNPILIQGYPTPGLLTLTGQGVFQADPKKPNRIRFENGSAALSRQDQGTRWAAVGTRIQNFGRNEEKRGPISFSLIAEYAGKTIACRIGSPTHSNGPAEIALKKNNTPKAEEEAPVTVIGSNGKILESFYIPGRLFPADIIFGINGSGRWSFYLNSLVDSSTLSREGSFDVPPGLRKIESKKQTGHSSDTPNTSAVGDLSQKGPISFECRLESTGSEPAEITLDNLTVGWAVHESKPGSAPFDLDPIREFDPVQAGWDLVFSDEFNGDQIDLSKWFYCPADHEKYAKVHNGLLEITADWDRKISNERVQSVSLYSNKLFGYGYYEARVKFRKESGWWSAFWLCTQGPSNPFIDGFEIDIYEDYYMGPKNPGEPARNILDHNLHVFAAGTLRSWNYNSTLTRKTDDFYVIGCKWTPFEISYYIDGKQIESQANHSPYDTVTFDPFNHAGGIIPLHAILSGCCGKSGGDPKKGNFPESFFVDYVRIYQDPRKDNPTVVWKSKPKAEQIVKPGQTLHFEAEVQPSVQTGAKIKQVYLFDSGALLDYKTAPPYSFDVKMTEDYYSATDFTKPGRSGIRPEFDRGTHAWSVFAQDENGRIAHSEPVIEYIRKEGTTRPWKGKKHELPGIIPLSHFDEGGEGYAYSDASPGNNASKTFRTDESVDCADNVVGSITAGEWLKYTIHAEKDGIYRFILNYGTPAKNQKGPKLLIDRTPAGSFETSPHKAAHWGCDTESVLVPVHVGGDSNEKANGFAKKEDLQSPETLGVSLSRGDHEIVLLMQGSYNINTLKAILVKVKNTNQK